MDRGQKGINQRILLCHFCLSFVCYLSIRLPPLGGDARYQPRRLVQRYYCCTANSLLLFFFLLSLSPSLPCIGIFPIPSPDSDTLDFSRSRDLFEESRESFDASAYDGREFPFGGRTIPVKNCSRNAEAVIPAIFIPFPFVSRIYAPA